MLSIGEVVVEEKEAWERGRRVWAGLGNGAGGCETAKMGQLREATACGLRVPCQPTTT